MQPQKLAPTTEVGCGLQKNSTFSEKRAKALIIFFFFIFLIFLAILTKPNRAKQSVVKRG
jgi:preprotein translocase subunit SecG